MMMETLSTLLLHSSFTTTNLLLFFKMLQENTAAYKVPCQLPSQNVIQQLWNFIASSPDCADYKFFAQEYLVKTDLLSGSVHHHH